MIKVCICPRRIAKDPDGHIERCDQLNERLSTVDFDWEVVSKFAKELGWNRFLVLDMIRDGVLTKDMKFQHGLDAVSAMAAYKTICLSLTEEEALKVLL